MGQARGRKTKNSRCSSSSRSRSGSEPEEELVSGTTIQTAAQLLGTAAAEAAAAEAAAAARGKKKKTKKKWGKRTKFEKETRPISQAIKKSDFEGRGRREQSNNQPAKQPTKQRAGVVGHQPTKHPFRTPWMQLGLILTLTRKARRQQQERQQR